VGVNWTDVSLKDETGENRLMAPLNPSSLEITHSTSGRSKRFVGLATAEPWIISSHTRTRTVMKALTVRRGHHVVHENTSRISASRPASMPRPLCGAASRSVWDVAFVQGFLQCREASSHLRKSRDMGNEMWFSSSQARKARPRREGSSAMSWQATTSTAARSHVYGVPARFFRRQRCRLTVRTGRERWKSSSCVIRRWCVWHDVTDKA